MNTTTHTADRNSAIDGLRFFGFVMVAILHTVSHPTKDISFEGIVEHIQRAAVPVYFMISGYLFTIGRRPPLEKLLRSIRRLLIIFVVWELIYIVIFAFLFQSLPKSFYSVRYALYTLYSGGVAFHLWFLPSLGLCLALLVVLQKAGWRLTIFLASALYLFALVFNPYADILGLTPFIKSIGFSDGLIPVRNGPFFGFIFVVLGALFASNGIRITKLSASLLAVAGLVVQIAEAIILSRFSAGNFVPYDFLIGTVPYAVGVFLFAQNTAPSLRFATLGRFALGMYCVHLAILLALNRSLPAMPYILSQTVTILLVIALSVAISLGLSKHRILKQIVS